jgi:WD40 repeat protein
MHRVSFSPDGKRLVTASEDFKVQVWPVDGIGEPVLLHEHGEMVQFAAFSPDGNWVMSVSEHARISRADGTGKPAVLYGHCCMFSGAFSPDSSRVIITGEDGDVRVFPADGSGKPLLLQGHTGDVLGAAFSPDGTRIVTASEDGTARVWRADGTGEPLILSGHDGQLSSAVFSPDGTRVVTASADGTVRVWRVTWPGLLDYMRENIDACLIPEQRVEYLMESPTEAMNAYTACEQRFGREVDTGVSVKETPGEVS